MRIQPRKINEYPRLLRFIFRNQEKKYGQMLIPAMIWGRLPRLFILVALFFSFFERKKSPLDPVLRSLVMVRVSQINWCKFCVDLNSMFLLERAGSSEKQDALENWRESGVFSEQERTALEYTDAITYSDREVSEEIVKSLKKYFSDDEIVELTGLIAYQNLSSKFNSALDIPAQGLCKTPVGK